MKNFPEHSRACDQCNMRRIRCTRQLPVCHACEGRKLTCSWNRQLGSGSNPSYQNVHTFSSSTQGRRYTKGTAKLKPKPIATFKHYSFVSQSLVVESTDRVSGNPDDEPENIRQKYPSLLAKFAPSVWSLALRKWLSTSSSRQDFYVVVKLSGVRLETASRQDHKFLSHILLNRLAPYPATSKMLLHVDTLNDTGSLLRLAVDAYFHYLNPFCFLFTRRDFIKHPRSHLLLLAVWRAGLQFLPQSLQGKALAESIDSLLASKLSLSQLKPGLDTLQTLLVVGIGINMATSARFHNKWPFFNVILSLTHLLGLHVASTQPTQIQLERALAYRAILFWDAQRVWSLGFPFFTPDIYFSTQKLPHATKASFKPSCKQAALFDAMDTCGLITSECLGSSAALLQRLYQLRLHTKQANITVPLGTLRATLCKSQKTYQDGCARVQLLRNSPALCDSKLTPVFDQTLCFLALCHHFSQLQMLEFASQVSSDVAHILKGISSAMQVIRFMSRIGQGPFLFARVSPLSCAFHFIVCHYHTYSSIYTTLTAPFATPAQLLVSLANAFRILQELKSNTLFSYYASAAIIMSKGLLIRYKIALPSLK